MLFQPFPTQFPANAKSIGAWRGKSEAQVDAEVKWERASEYFASKLTEDEKKRGVRVKLFEGAIEPKDVGQGQVGNCWLIAAFACICEHPGPPRPPACLLPQSYCPMPWRRPECGAAAM